MNKFASYNGKALVRLYTRQGPTLSGNDKWVPARITAKRVYTATATFEIPSCRRVDKYRPGRRSQDLLEWVKT